MHNCQTCTTNATGIQFYQIPRIRKEIRIERDRERERESREKDRDEIKWKDCKNGIFCGNIPFRFIALLEGENKT